MATAHLPPDFKEFIQLLNSHHVKYLLIGGYAVGYYGYPGATTISGVSFEECYAARRVDELDGVDVNLISLDDLKVNKKASGRYKDLNDLENLP
jgi:hypothetical protein